LMNIVEPRMRSRRAKGRGQGRRGKDEPTSLMMRKIEDQFDSTDAIATVQMDSYKLGQRL
jgi:hypothetical protein